MGIHFRISIVSYFNMVGTYRIENTASEHASVLKSAVVSWGERQPDVYLVSKEGVKVYTQRILLCFYSKILGTLLESNRDDLAGINVPASSSSLTMMLKVLVSGSVIGNNKENLLEVGQAAEAMGIVLNDRQIGYRRKSQGGSLGVMKETVEISGRKVSYSKSSEQDIASVVKTEPKEQSEGAESADVSVQADKKEKLKPKKKKEKVVEAQGAENVDEKTCATCGKMFPTAGRLQLHMNVHKEDKEKPYKCDVCEKGFSSSASLKNHKLLHTGEVHKCEFCEYTAVQKGNLKTHRMKVHKDLLEKNESSENPVGELVVDMPENIATKEELHDNESDDIADQEMGEKENMGDVGEAVEVASAEDN